MHECKILDGKPRLCYQLGSVCTVAMLLTQIRVVQDTRFSFFFHFCALSIYAGLKFSVMPFATTRCPQTPSILHITL